MIWTIIFILLGLAVCTAAPRFIPDTYSAFRPFVVVLGGLIVAYTLLSTSFIHVGPNETAQVHKIYFGADLPEGTIIATKGEKGPQARVFGPGFHYSFMMNVLNTIETKDVVIVPDDKVGLLFAKDGAPFRADQAFADPLHAFIDVDTKEPVEVGRMISDAAYFLKNGGQKGPQSTVLKPGSYRLNNYLWEVVPADALDVAKGQVAVIKSNVYGAVDMGEVMKVNKPSDCTPVLHNDPKKLAAPLVPVGCVGIWNVALPPGKYYINPKAYQHTPVDTRQQAWLYRGGYIQRTIALAVDDKGEIKQVETPNEIAVPEGAADKAVEVKVEGWAMHQAVRALVQVTPENAPFVVASVGGMAEVEDRVVTPVVQSLLTNIAGGSIKVLDEKGVLVVRPTHALDFIEQREAIEDMLEPAMIHEAGKAGVLMQEVRLLETDFPPELLVARKREQLAGQLELAYHHEQTAQTARVAVEQEKATANQQKDLVTSQINMLKARQDAEADIERGRGERGRLMQAAEGQKAQMEVLGKDKVTQLQMLTQFLTFLEKNHTVLESALSNMHKIVPNTVVNTGGSGGIDLLSAATAVMGMQKEAGAEVKQPAVPATQTPNQ